MRQAPDRKLLRAAKALKSGSKVKYVWTRSENVKIRETDTSPVIWLQDDSQLEEWYEEQIQVEHQETLNTANNMKSNIQNNPSTKRTAEERSPVESATQKDGKENCKN